MVDMTNAPATSRWPTGTEYAASVQQPTTSFSDAELQQGRLTLTPLGIPASASGQSAIAFHMEAPTRPVAVRCLLSAHDDGRIRYRALREHVEERGVPSVVPAKWLDEGVRTNGEWWPIVVMPWVSGAPLHIAIEDRLDDSERLSRLADRWLDLVESMQDKEFAHGDLQHGNVLLTDADEFQLVDLDGVWVPDMGCGAPNEYGHPNYQHVNRSDTDWGPFVDTFSALAIALSILALSADSSLSRFMTGENLLFVKTDFENPTSSEVWRALNSSTDEEVVDLAQRLQGLARQGRMPAMSVRDVLDASFDAAALAPEPTGTTPPTVGGRPSAVPASDNWWAGGTSAPPTPGGSPAPAPSASGSATVDSFWTGVADSQIAESQPEAPGAPGQTTHVAPAPDTSVRSSPPAPTAGQPPPIPPPVVTPAMARAAEPHSTGLARFTGQPVVAGLVSGALAGLIGCLLAGVVQGAVDDPRAAGGIFVGMIAAMLGGFVHAWPALNLSNFGLAIRRFLVGAFVGAVAGVASVLAADAMTKSALSAGDVENPLLVSYIWALTASLIGLAVGLLRSPKAGAYAFSGGAVAGFGGGLVHGSTNAEFENRALQVSGFDGGVLLIASFVAMLIGVFVSIAIRTARSGSLTVIEGPGSGTVIDFHTDRVTIGGSGADTLVVKGKDLAPKAIQLHVGQRHAEVTSEVAILLDGAPQPQHFAVYPGQVMAFAGMFIRVDIKSESGRGGPS